ncbi:DnaJ domain-containing protein [Pseudarthrobacter sp. N5]|uniref:DnaJ domain-containing protein n=1 Tax=Pseudarthrobacter sp. N5 TaxID=3418416 RepID=UPI003CF23B98
MKEHSPDPYDVLHSGPAGTAGDVTRAYRALMRTHDPDTTPAEAVPAERESRAQELHDIMDAYAVLGDPGKRPALDRQRQRPPLPEPGPPHRPADSRPAARQNRPTGP